MDLVSCSPLPSNERIVGRVGHTEGVAAIAFSPKGDLLLSGGHDHTVRLWDVASGTQMKLLFDHREDIVDFTPQHPPLDVMGVAFSPAGNLAAAGIRDHTVRLWDMESGKGIGVLRGHEGGVLSMGFSPDSKQIAAGGHDWTIYVWDVKTQNSIHKLVGHQDSTRSVVFTDHANTLMSSSDDGTIRFWNLKTGTT